MKKLALGLAFLIGSVASAAAACTGPAVMHDFPGTSFNMSLATVPDGNCGSNVALPTWAGGTLGAMANYGTSPGAVLVPGVNAFVTNTVTVSGTVTATPTGTQAVSAAVSTYAAGAGVDGWDLTQGAIADAAVTAGATGSVSAKLRSISRDVMTTNTWAGGTLGAMAAYGTSPGAVLVPGANVFVTNTLTGITPGDAIATGTYPTGSPTIGAMLLWNGTTYDRWKSAGVTGVAAVRQTDGTNVGQLDPCQSEVKSTLPITLATAAVKVIAVGVSAKKIYVCQIHLTNNAADSVAVFEATTATTCATSPVAVVGAGTTVATAATGYNFAANGGISLGTGSNQVLQTSVNANDLCIAQSAATQLTGSITYVTR